MSNVCKAMIGLSLLGTSCLPPKVAPATCAVIDLAHLACGEFVTVTLRDGRVAQVPREQLAGAIERTALAALEKETP